MITFRPLDDANRSEVEALRTSPEQERFVSPVTRSLQEALEEPGAHAIQWAMYDDGTPVGFVMIADEVEGDEYLPQFLWKLLIDRDHQRKGNGTAALVFVSDFFRERGRNAMWTSAGEGDGGPIPFYERFGFVRTGEVHGEEAILRLEL